MDIKQINYHALLRDELIYEVAIRAETPADSVAKLKRQLQSRLKEFGPEDIIDDDSKAAVELPIIAEKLKELQTKIDNYKSTRAQYLLTRAKGLYCHLHFRLERVNCKEVADQEIQIAMRSKLDKSFATLNSLVLAKKQEESQHCSSCSGTSADRGEDKPQNGNILKWNIKFNGTSSPHSFIEAVNERATAFGVSDAVLLKSAFLLFSDQGLVWYRGIKDQVSTWTELSDLLIEEFAPSDLDYRLLGEIRSRTQGQDEPTHIYFAVMNAMFARLKVQLSESDKLDILKHNIRPSFYGHLALQNITSLSELKEKCRMIESARKMSSEFTEPPKHSNCCPEYVYKGKQASQKMPAAPVTKTQPIKKEQPKQGSDQKIFCNRCKVDTHSTKQCRDKVIKCFNCGELGYFTRSCVKCKQNKNKNTKN